MYRQFRGERGKLREVEMSESRGTKGMASGREAKLRPRRPYHKPTVRYERVFEVQALTCGKVYDTQGSCRFNHKSS
jgi:hypothetical protein